MMQFFIELQEWIDAGFPEHESFSTRWAICWNAGFYDNSITEELSELLDESFPFNDTYEEYAQEIRNNTLW